MDKIYDELRTLLKGEKKYFTDGGELIKTAVYADAMAANPALIKLLLKGKESRKRFFIDADGVLVFDKTAFGWVVNNRNFLPDSYTRYKNKIGLTSSDGDFLSACNDVAIAFPYKDCVLEFDSTAENDKREEIFYNELLSRKEIDRLFEKKVFDCAVRHGAKGSKPAAKFEEGDSIVIKGNNLITMHSLLPRFEKSVKCMYWDILYNTNSDEVPYGDRFKHSSWLTMMKNRLDVAWRLLKKEGVICLQCDDNEMAYLKVLTDEIFGRDNHVNTICVKMSELKGFKMGNVQNKFPKLKEYILIYAKDKSCVKMKVETKPKDNLNDYAKYYNKRIVNIDDDCSLWKVEKAGRDFDKVGHAREMIYPVTRDSKTKENLPVGKFCKISDGDGKQSVVYFDGKKVKTVLFLSDYVEEPVGDIWTDISTININKESSVQLKNGKKPESLVKRIICAFTDEGDYVLDAYFGTGTTGAVALKTNRRFIGLEQLDDHYEKSIARLKEVIAGDKSGISAECGYEGGGEFISCELAKLNQKYIEKIAAAKSDKELFALSKEMLESGFVSSRVDPSEIDPDADDFRSLKRTDKKKLLFSLLDKNMLYVNYCDSDDENFSVSENAKKFTQSLYGEETE